MSPKNAAHLTNIAAVLVWKSQWTSAIKVCDLAIAAGGDRARPYDYRGLALESLGKRATAQAHYDNACQLRPSLAELLPKYESAYLYVENKTGEPIVVQALYEAKTISGT